MKLKKSSKNASLSQEKLDGIVGESGLTVSGYRVTSDIRGGTIYDTHDKSAGGV